MEVEVLYTPDRGKCHEKSAEGIVFEGRMKMARKGNITIPIVFGMFLVYVIQAGEVLSRPDDSRDSAAAVLLEERCTVCHSLKWVRRSRKSYPMWEETVGRMVRKGARLNDEEKEELLRYLAEHYGNE